ncbi:hypothetical protein ACFZAG_39705 [Streptomyces sp. NPDC012403]|uniref:hypothetical protein n=1 Tax=unclassified Streptomyces TaxID=2593676 RepID=UPI0036E54B82
MRVVSGDGGGTAPGIGTSAAYRAHPGTSLSARLSGLFTALPGPAARPPATAPNHADVLGALHRGRAANRG